MKSISIHYMSALNSMGTEGTDPPYLSEQGQKNLDNRKAELARLMFQNSAAGRKHKS